MSKKLNQQTEEYTSEEKDKKREDEIAERIFKYSQGCSFIMMVIITIIVFLLLFYLS
ncbi:hypothetical protein AAK882_10140 [Carnobacteriaceae bacterium 52-44]